jgi:protein TonB
VQVPAEPVAAAPSQSADAPRYAGDGFQSPQLAERNCISENLRLPSQLGEAIPDMVTARVAVSTAGQATTVQVMGQVADPRISDAVRRAVQACSWIPGADAQGKPTALWVVLPIRLTR